MASKTVQPLVIDLGIKGAEKLAGLKSSFRDLAKTVSLTDSGLEEARQGIIKYAKSANQSEALIRGQIKAFEGLREQAELGGKVFIQLGSDIDALKGVLYGASTAVEAKRKSLVDLGSSADATATQIQDAIRALTALRNETRLDSEAFNAFGQSIDRLAERFEKAKQEAQDFANAQARSGRLIGASSGAAKQQINDLTLVTEALREQREELGRLEGEARIRRGVADLAERGAVSSSRRSYQEALAESVLSGTAEEVAGTGASLKKLLSTKDIRAALAEVELQIAEFQKQVESKLSRGLQISFQETSRSARESARAMAAAFADPELLGILDRLDQRIGELPNTTTGFNQRLRELQQQLANTARDSNAYVSVSLEIARVQREASAATQGLGAALIKDLASGVAVRNQKNLREAIGQLQAEMSELNTETTEGSAKYAENARQVNNLQKELDQIANSYRNVADMTRRATASQVDYGAVARKMYLERDQPGYKTPAEIRGKQFLERIDAERQVLRQTLALPAAGQTSAPGTGAFMSGANVKPKIAPEARLYSSTGERPDQPSRGFPGDVEAIAARRAIGPQQPGPSGQAYIYAAEARRKEAEATKAAADAVKNYRAEIDKARKANDGSINSSNRLRTAIIRFRDTLPPTSKEFADLTKQINNLDRQSERVSRRMSRRRMSPMQMTQAAGAVLSGGIFGGPEGFLGGAIGAIGGVGGAFAGAAIGAQVGGIRRTLGEYADYAAEIKRLEIALKGITEVQDDAVASQANYSRAVAAAADVTKDLNVPQEVAIRGITRLTAAVKGAGGGVADAELAFKNITSAITATGGGAEQVQGAVTALVQIFSKGKVSAEEINQIAERLPGTFNKIAEASGRTGPELTKALQKGEVGLNDLMKFLVQLGGEYGELAEKIAGSSEAAGQRLQVAYNNMRIEVGNALRPIGAEFQDAFTEFIKDITPTLVAVLPKIGEAFLAIAKNIDIVVVAMTAALGVFAVGKIAAIIGSIGGLAAAIFTLKLNAIVAAKALVGLNSAALLNPYTALAAGVAAFAANIYLASKRQKELNNLIRQGPVAEVQSKIKQLQSEQAEIEQRSLRPRSAIESAGDLLLGVDPRAADEIRLAEIKNLLPKLRERLRTAEYDAKQGAALDSSTFGLTVFDEPKPDGTGTGTGTGKVDKGPKSRLPELKAQYDSMVRGEKGVLEIMSMRQEQAMLLARATADNNQELISTANLKNISLDFAERELEIEKKLLDDLDKASRLEVESDKNQARKNAQLEHELELAKLLLGVEGAIALEKQRAAIAEEERSKAMSDQLFTLREQLGLVTDNERIARFRQEQEKQFGQDDPRAAEATDLFRQTVAPTFAEGLGQKIRELKEDLEGLVNPINQITFAANTIGTAFSQSFGEVITGSKSIKEALSDAFASIGKAFIDMATQIIAKQLVLITLGTIMKALGIAAGAGSGANPNSANVGSVLDSGGFTTGNMADQAAAGTFAFGRANGGPVNANQPYIVGERGPELFIPSQQGNITSNEELKAQMRETSSAPMAYTDRLRETSSASMAYTDRLRETREVMLPFTRSAEQASMVAAERETAQAISNPGPIDVRYESTVVNGVEYVTAEQHQAGMAQAAERGRALTLMALQNSVKTRRRVGL